MYAVDTVIYPTDNPPAKTLNKRIIISFDENPNPNWLIPYPIIPTISIFLLPWASDIDPQIGDITNWAIAIDE